MRKNGSNDADKFCGRPRFISTQKLLLSLKPLPQKTKPSEPAQEKSKMFGAIEFRRGSELNTKTHTHK